jgi:hypothetical protein
MIRRPTTFALAAAVAVAVLLSACDGGNLAPALSDPKAIVTAALKATEAAKSAHIDATVSGTANVKLRIGGSGSTPIDLTGTTATADIDFARPATHASVAVPALLDFSGDLIAVGGKSYLKTSLGGPLYQVSATPSAATDPLQVTGIVDNLGDLLLKDGVDLAKGADVTCGSKQCYTVTAAFTAAQLGLTAPLGAAGASVDLAGATLKLTLRVEKDLPYHLAGLTAVVTMADASSLTAEVTASKWDEPVTVVAPPADQVRPSP